MTSDLRSLPSGTVLSDYRLEGVLGHGGFGITYLATDLSLDQRVAIKEYYPREFAVRDSTRTVHATGSSEDRDNFTWGHDRFGEEARTLARFSHLNIIAVRRLFEANGTSYIVMDFCEGEPLDAVIKREAPLSAAVLERVFGALLDGLEHVHAAGVMHRDIKPANIFLRADGSPVLLDFGAARQALVSHSRSMTSLATAHYAAFEQYSTRGNQGPWTDIYGLSATLYHAATGEKPQDAPDRMLEDKVEALSSRAAGQYPRGLLQAIDAGLAVRPENRPQTVEQWRRMMEPGAVPPPPSGQGYSPPANAYDPPTSGRKTGVAVLAALAGIFAMLVVILIVVVSRGGSGSPEANAETPAASVADASEAAPYVPPPPASSEIKTADPSNNEAASPTNGSAAVDDALPHTTSSPSPATAIAEAASAAAERAQAQAQAQALQRAAIAREQADNRTRNAASSALRDLGITTSEAP